MAVLLLMMVGFAYRSGITAFAAVDLDVTIIPPADTVQNGKNFDVELEIATKSANGYVDLVINIEYDADLLALYAPVNQDGYRITGSRGQLKLVYMDPTGTNTPTAIGDAPHIPITFTVMANAPDTKTKIKASIDHAYNARGKNVTWTPIYDKEIEIIRINEGVSSEDVSSEEESSQFVVGANTGAISRSSAAGGTGGKIAAVILGAAVVFAAGMACGYILCMKQTENGAHPSRTADKPRPKRREPELYDEDDGDFYGYRPRTRRQEAEPEPQDGYEGYDNDDGFYTKPMPTSTPSGDDYPDAPAVGSSLGGGFFDTYRDIPANHKSAGSRRMSSDDFSRIIEGSARVSDLTGGSDDGEDDYPSLFLSRESSGTSRRRAAAPASPTFDEEEDTIFGKFSGNVNRNTDDGYGGISSDRRRDRDRSERSRRNR